MFFEECLCIYQASYVANLASHNHFKMAAVCNVRGRNSYCNSCTQQIDSVTFSELLKSLSESRVFPAHFFPNF